LQQCATKHDFDRSPAQTTRHKNDSFLDSDDARPLRIFAEYLEPMHDFHRERVCDTIV